MRRQGPVLKGRLSNPDELYDAGRQRFFRPFLPRPGPAALLGHPQRLRLPWPVTPYPRSSPLEVQEGSELPARRHGLRQLFDYLFLLAAVVWVSKE